LKSLRWFIILLVLFLASCVYDNELTYMNDQILTLNKRIAELEGSFEPKVDERIDLRVADKLAGINATQADMSAEVDTVKRDVGELTGRVEDNEHLIQRFVEKDLNKQDAISTELAEAAALSARVDELENLLRKQQGILGLDEYGEGREEEPSAVIDGSGSDAPGLYGQSLAIFRDDKYEEARQGFKEFLKENPKSDYADNAQYWIGECLMGLKQYEQAILAFNEVIKKYPKGNKVPNAMYRQAVAFLEIDDNISARLLLEKVIKQYPNEDIVKAAKAKLKSIQ